MDSDDMLMSISAVIVIAVFSFVGGLQIGVDFGKKKGADCILSGHKVTEDYECIDIDKLRGKQ